MVSLTPGASSSGSIGHKDLIHNREKSKMNGGGQGCPLMVLTRRARIYPPVI